MTVGGMGFIPERLLMMMILNGQLTVSTHKILLAASFIELFMLFFKGDTLRPAIRPIKIIL